MLADSRLDHCDARQRVHLRAAESKSGQLLEIPRTRELLVSDTYGMAYLATHMPFPQESTLSALSEGGMNRPPLERN